MRNDHGMADRKVVELVERWGTAERDRRRACAVYARIAARVGDRIDYLDGHPEKRAPEQLTHDRALLDEQALAGHRAMEAESLASRLLEQLRCAAVSLLDADLCVQCLANATSNESGGYYEAADRCRDYCRSGHTQPIVTPRLEP